MSIPRHKTWESADSTRESVTLEEKVIKSDGHMAIFLVCIGSIFVAANLAMIVKVFWLPPVCQ